MKSIPRKTKPVAAQAVATQPIPFVWRHPIGCPMGHLELHHAGRVVARVTTINPRRVGGISRCDWRYEVFDAEGRIVEQGVVVHQIQARERAYQIAERLRKRGLI